MLESNGQKPRYFLSSVRPMLGRVVDPDWYWALVLRAWANRFGKMQSPRLHLPGCQGEWRKIDWLSACFNSCVPSQLTWL